MSVVFRVAQTQCPQLLGKHLSEHQLAGRTGVRCRRLVGVRFCVLPPPFSRWVIFYLIINDDVEILRVIYGTQNWRGNPASFFI